MTKILSTRQTDTEVTAFMDIPSAMASRSLFWKAQFVQSAPILPHVPLLFWLVDAARPSVVATLGLGDGVGHFALCQAVDKLDLPAVCQGYDTDPASKGVVAKSLQDHNEAHYDHLSQLSALDLKTSVARIGQSRVDLFLIEVPGAQEDIDFLIRTIPEKMAASGIVVLHGTGRGKAETHLRNAFAALSPASAVLDFDAGDGICIALLSDETTPRAARLFEQLRSGKSGRSVATTILRRLGAAHVLEAQSKTLLADKLRAEAEVEEAKRASETAKTRLAELTEAYDLRGRKSGELQARLFDLQQEKTAAQTSDLQSQAKVAELEAQVARSQAELADQVAEGNATLHALETAQQELQSALTDLAERAHQAKQLEAALTEAQTALASQTAALAEAEERHRDTLRAAEELHASALQAVEDTNAAALAEAEERHRDTLRAAGELHASALQAVEDTNAAALAEAEERHRDTLRDAEDKYASALEAVDDRYAAALAEAEERHSTALRAAEEQHASALQAVKDTNAAALAEAEERHSTALRAAEEQHASALQAAEDRNAAALAEAEKSLEQRFHELALLTQRLDKSLAEEERLKAEVARAEADLQAQQAAAQTDAAAQASHHQAQLDALSSERAAAQTQHQQEVTHLRATLAETEKSLNQRFHELALLTKRLDKTIAEEEQLRDVLAKTEAELTARLNAQEITARNAAEKQAQAAKAQLDALAADLARSETLRQQEVAELRAALIEQEKDLTQVWREVLTEREKDLARVWRDAAKLEDRMLKVYSSSSWSLTRPLRALTRLIKRSKPAPAFKTRYINTPQPEGSGRLARVLPVMLREVAHPGSLTQEKLVRFLRYQLWGGASDAALPRLEAMLTSAKSTGLAKLRAASALSTWFDYCGDPARAMTVLETLSDQPDDISRDRSRIVRMAVLQANAGRRDEAAATLETILDSQKDATDVRLVRANLAANDGQRLSRINKVFDANGFAPLRRIDAKAPLSIGNIETGPVAQTIDDQGLVSVIMPTFNAGATIDTALRSLLAQSYRNIEVIVVDDCSTDDTAQVVQRLAESDPRLRLIRQEKNAGAYPARNRGLAEARGAFLTTHDSDDWSHPQKIEQQLMVLSSKPKAMGTMTHWARVKPSLHFTTNWRLSDEVVHWSHSSLLFRRAVFEKLGGWDNVRVSGDTEFIWRIEAAFGRYSVPRILKQVPLAFALDDDSSLTRTKLTHVSTTYYGLRHYYREISRYWLSKHPKGLTEAAKAAKWAMLPIEIRERSDGPVTVDLWFRGDMTNKATVAKMTTLLRANKGKSIGVTHVTDPLLERDVPSYAALFCNEFFEFLQSSGARIVLPGVEVKTDQALDLNSQRK